MTSSRARPLDPQRAGRSCWRRTAARCRSGSTRRHAGGPPRRRRPGLRARPAGRRHRRHLAGRGHDRRRSGGGAPDRWSRPRGSGPGCSTSTPTQFAMAYDVVCNATLWFLYHGLFDLARRPRFDHRFTEAWDAYRAVNRGLRRRRIAETAPDGAAVLVQDYHLSLVGPMLAAAPARPAHRALQPHAVRRARSAAGAARPAAPRSCSRAWPATTPAGSTRPAGPTRSRPSCEEIIGRTPTTFVSPLASDPDDIRGRRRLAGLPRGARRARRTCSATGCCIARVDRIELSKNIVRGFHAYDDLLRTPRRNGASGWCSGRSSTRRGRGCPSTSPTARRSSRCIDAINRRWRTPTWEPILADLSDDFPRSVAALCRYDVLLVNPIRDGLNLVAKEGPLVNRRDGLRGAQPRGRRVGRAGRRGPAGASLRHHRHRRRLGIGACRRRPTERADGGGRAAPPSRGPHPRRTGSPTSSPPPGRPRPGAGGGSERSPADERRRAEPGPRATLTVLVRLAWPRTICTARRGTPRRSARNRTSSALALPSIGRRGDAGSSASRRAGPTTSDRAAPGWTRSSSTQPAVDGPGPVEGPAALAGVTLVEPSSSSSLTDHRRGGRPAEGQCSVGPPSSSSGSSSPGSGGR